MRADRARGEVVGLNIQFGGQTPLKLAKALEAAGVPILGTRPDAIDLAEDRDRFRRLLQELGLRQPENATCHSVVEARKIAAEIGYPVMVRPSYVLGGRAMRIIHDVEALDKYMSEAVKVSGDSPVLVDSFLQDAIEVDVDALADGSEVFVAGVMEHIEEAGVHSGDSACSLPPHSLDEAIIAEIRAQTEALAKALEVRGLMNVQFAVKDDEVYVLEVNPRASRTVPFVAKSTGRPIAKLAAQIMAGRKLAELEIDSAVRPHMAVKEAVFPFARFPGVDLILGPEMKSTGEVMGIDNEFGRAVAKAQIGACNVLPLSGRVFLSVRDRDKPAICAIAKQLHEMGFHLVATHGTMGALREAGLPVERTNKVREGRPHVVDMIKDGGVQLLVNTTEGAQAIADSYLLRRTALERRVPYFTTLPGSRAMVQAIHALKSGGLEVATLQSYCE